MPKYCMVNRLKAEHIEDYCQIHKNCWPEMRQALIDAGARNCTIFVHGNLSIVFYECDNLEESLSKLGQTEINKKWQAVVDPWFEKEGICDGYRGKSF